MRGTRTACCACVMLLGAVPVYAAEAPEQQVLAKLGNAVITVQDFLLLAPFLPGLVKQQGAEAGKRQLLESLIGQELFAQEAVRLGLEQSSEVQAMLKQARVNVLSQAYMKWRAAQGIDISDEEIAEYFEAHPDEFQGKTLPEASTEIKAKLSSASFSNLLARAKAELGQHAGVEVDEKLLSQVPVGSTAP